VRLEEVAGLEHEAAKWTRSAFGGSAKGAKALAAEQHRQDAPSIPSYFYAFP
jgi:hypothetical protein